MTATFDYSSCDPRINAAWMKPLVEWVLNSPYADEDCRILDYGFGYFDFGRLLAGHTAAVVDGFEISAAALAHAEHVCRDCGLSGNIYRQPGDIPAATYDLIVAHSVVQYFEDLAELTHFLIRARSWLSGRPYCAVLLTDLIPPCYPRWRDATDSLRFARSERVLGPMVRHLARAACSPGNTRWLRLPDSALELAANHAGLTWQRLPRNLTPSQHRFSGILHLPAGCDLLARADTSS